MAFLGMKCFSFGFKQFLILTGSGTIYKDGVNSSLKGHITSQVVKIMHGLLFSAIRQEENKYIYFLPELRLCSEDA